MELIERRKRLLAVQRAPPQPSPQISIEQGRGEVINLLLAQDSHPNHHEPKHLPFRCPASSWVFATQNLRHGMGREESAKLGDASRVEFMFIAKGHRLQRQDRFAGFIHPPDRFLESRRGDDRAELALVVDNNPDAARNGRTADAGDIGGSVSFCAANADGVGLLRHAFVTDVDIVVTGGKVARSFTPERNIFVAGPVVIERVEGSRQLNSLRILLG